MEYPADLKYTKDHEWVRVENGVATVGITEFAQEELGEIVFVELPSEGDELEKGQSFCVLESTKAASDVYAPISGKIQEANTKLSDDPALVNSSSYIDGWLVKLSDINEDELGELMDAEEYESMVG